MEAQAETSKRTLADVLDEYFEAHPSPISAGEAFQRFADATMRNAVAELLDKLLGTYPLPSAESIAIAAKLVPPKESQP